MAASSPPRRARPAFRLPLGSLPVGTVAALVVVLLLAGAIGYVYSHEPTRDALAVDLVAAPEGGASTISGTVIAVTDSTITIADASGGERTLTFAPGAPIEAMTRLAAAPSAGAIVNIGVDDTPFGQFVTGIVTIEAAP